MAESMQVSVPDGVVPGTSFTVSTPDGQYLTLDCPEGVNPGDPIVFSYMPLAAAGALPPLPPPPGEGGAEEGSSAMHPDDFEIIVKALPPPVGEWTGNVMPAASYGVGQNLIVTRSTGEESGCQVVEVFLTALGPQYNVYLGMSETNEPVCKWCGDSDL